MNISRANNLDFPDLLDRMGYKPVEVKKGQYWYLSPLRVDKNPSFQVRKGDTYNWVWHDFGLNLSPREGTTVLNFIRLYRRNPDKKEALKYLDSLYPHVSKRVGGQKTKSNPDQFSFLSSPQSPPQAPIEILENQDSRDLEFIKDSPLQSPLIFAYLEGRGIPRELGSKIFRLVHYRNRNRATQAPYFGIGMSNINGGWEVRSASDDPKLLFKSALLRRDITLVRGTQEDRADLVVVEGMMDYASLLVLRGREQLKADLLILNGLQSYNRAKWYIERYEYKRIFTMLDNNPAGQATAEIFADNFGDMVVNLSHTFEPFVDLNDALKANHVLNLTKLPDPPQP